MRLTDRPRRHLYINHTHLLASEERPFGIGILDPCEQGALELLPRILNAIWFLFRPLEKAVECLEIISKLV